MAEKVHDDYLRSRAAMHLDAERRAAEEQAKHAREEATSLALSPQGIVGRVGTQLGRMIHVEVTPGAVVIRDPHNPVHGGVLTALDREMAGQFAAALREAIHPEKLNRPGHQGTVARVATLPVGSRSAGVVIERAATGVLVRDAAISHHGGLLVQVNSEQTAQLLDALTRALR